MVKRQKTKSMVAKHQKAGGVISLLSEDEKNYESDIGDKTNLYKDNNEYLL